MVSQKAARSARACALEHDAGEGRLIAGARYFDTQRS
jgi:hypothetical protein